MVAYVVLTREKLRDPSEMAEYGKAARAVAHDGKLLAAYGRHESLEGAPIEGAVILEFATIEAAKAWYYGPGYSEARVHRFKGADYRAFITEGV
jgi:uncharacterized protein (DUF1330 family)